MSAAREKYVAVRDELNSGVCSKTAFKLLADFYVLVDETTVRPSNAHYECEGFVRDQLAALGTKRVISSR
jgi:hypothetical protein